MKAVIIGTGFGARVVAPIYQKVGIEVEVVSPRDPAAVRRACAAPVDLVSVHSPPFLHREHVMLALEHNHNVVCDKPFGRSAAEAREMLNAAEAAGVLHFANFEFRQEGVRKKAKELIAQGAIGTVKHVHWTAMMSASRVPLQSYRWLWDRSLGGGWINAFGSHAIDTLRFWIGEVNGISGICRHEIPYRLDADRVEHRCTAEDAFTACLTFESGASAVIDTSYASSVTRPYSIEIFGSEGTLIMDYGTTLELKRSDKADRQFTFAPWTGDMHESALSEWAKMICDAVLQKQQISPSLRDGLACAEIMDNFRTEAVWLTQHDRAPG